MRIRHIWALSVGMALVGQVQADISHYPAVIAAKSYYGALAQANLKTDTLALLTLYKPTPDAADPDEWFPFLGRQLRLDLDHEFKIRSYELQVAIENPAHPLFFYDCMAIATANTSVALMDFNVKATYPYGIGNVYFHEPSEPDYEVLRMDLYSRLDPEVPSTMSENLGRRFVAVFPSSADIAADLWAVQGGTYPFVGRDNDVYPPLPSGGDRPRAVKVTHSPQAPAAKVHREVSRPDGNLPMAVGMVLMSRTGPFYEHEFDPEAPPRTQSCEFWENPAWPIGNVTQGTYTFDSTLVAIQSYIPKNPAEYCRDLLDYVDKQQPGLRRATDQERKAYADHCWDQAIRFRSGTAETSSENLALRDCEYFFRGLAGGYRSRFLFGLNDFNDVANNTIPISTPIYNTMKHLLLLFGLKKTDGLSEQEIVQRLFGGEASYPLPGTPSEGLTTGYLPALLGYMYGAQGLDIPTVRSRLAALTGGTGELDGTQLLKALIDAEPLPRRDTSPADPLPADEQYSDEDDQARLEQDYYALDTAAGEDAHLSTEYESGDISYSGGGGGAAARPPRGAVRLGAPVRRAGPYSVGDVRTQFIVATVNNAFLGASVDGPLRDLPGPIRLVYNDRSVEVQPGAYVPFTDRYPGGVETFRIEGVEGRRLNGSAVTIRVRFRDAGHGLVGITTLHTAVGPGSRGQAQAPLAAARPASDLSPSGATLNAAVNPQGAPTEVVFEYGPTPDYGNITPGVPLGNGFTPMDISLPISGLEPNRVYRFRAVASNSQGTVFGEDRVFATGGTTPVGTEVAVLPLGARDEAQGVTVLFDEVVSEGTTRVHVAAPGAPPSGFRWGQPARLYEISTTASHAGAIQLWFSYAGVAFANESELRLFHFEGDKWVDVTDSIDPARKTVHGTVRSLSPFALFEPEAQPANRPPTPVNDSAGTALDTPLTLSALKVLSNDSDPDGDPLTVTAVFSPSAQGGTVALTGTRIAYTPPAGFAGLDSFTCQIADGRGGVVTSTVTVTVRDDGARPPSIVRLESPGPDRVVLTLAGIPGRTYGVEVKQALSDPTWTRVASPTAGPDGLYRFEDTAAGSSRFYRVVHP